MVGVAKHERADEHALAPALRITAYHMVGRVARALDAVPRPRRQLVRRRAMPASTSWRWVAT